MPPRASGPASTETGRYDMKFLVELQRAGHEQVMLRLEGLNDTMTRLNEKLDQQAARHSTTEQELAVAKSQQAGLKSTLDASIAKCDRTEQDVRDLRSELASFKQEQAGSWGRIIGGSAALSTVVSLIIAVAGLLLRKLERNQ